jgi:hypothetical protein
MPTKRVRLNQETQGTVAGEGHRTMVKLPEGSEIALVGPVAGHPEMVEVSWNGQSAWIFAIDFEARTNFEAPNSGDRPPLARAKSVGAGTPEPEANTPTEAKIPANTQHKTARTPRVRRFNAAGRELL